MNCTARHTHRFLNPLAAVNILLVVALTLTIILCLSFGSVHAQSRDVVKFGADLMVEEGMHIRDVVVLMGDITVDGPVARDVVVIGGSIILTNKAAVGRNVVAIAGSIEQSEDAEVGGDLTEVNIPGLYTLINAFSGGNWTGPFLFFAIWPIICFAGFLTLSLLVTAFFPESTRTIARQIAAKPVKSGLTGMMIMLLIVPLGILLAISILGLVLIPVEMIAVSTALLVGYITVARLVGGKMAAALKRPQTAPLWETFWGIIVLGIIGLIPVLGWIVNALVIVTGLGGVWLSFVTNRRRRETQTNIEPQDY